MASSGGQRELVEQRWKQIRSSIKQRWPQLTDDELQMVGGDSRKLVALVNQKSDEPIHQIEQEIDRIASESGGLLARLTQSASDLARSTGQQAARPLSWAYQQTGSVSDRPAQWMTAMFAAGFVVGFWLGWPSKSKRSSSKWW